MKITMILYFLAAMTAFSTEYEYHSNSYYGFFTSINFPGLHKLNKGLKDMGYPEFNNYGISKNLGLYYIFGDCRTIDPETKKDVTGSIFKWAHLGFSAFYQLKDNIESNYIDGDESWSKYGYYGFSFLFGGNLLHSVQNRLYLDFAFTLIKQNLTLSRSVPFSGDNVLDVSRLSKFGIITELGLTFEKDIFETPIFAINPESSAYFFLGITGKIYGFYLFPIEGFTGPELTAGWESETADNIDIGDPLNYAPAISLKLGIHINSVSR